MTRPIRGADVVTVLVAFTAVVRASEAHRRDTDGRRRFEDDHVRPSYGVAAKTMNAWSKGRGFGSVPAVYTSQIRTWQTIEQRRDAFVQTLPEREPIYRDAAACACWIWAMRRLGEDLVRGLYQEPLVAGYPDVSQDYPHAIDVTEQLWRVADGESDDIIAVIEPLSALAYYQGDHIWTMSWLLRACADAANGWSATVADVPGEQPALPLALWARRAKPHPMFREMVEVSAGELRRALEGRAARRAVLA